jgi:hypothetical protein
VKRFIAIFESLWFTIIEFAFFWVMINVWMMIYSLKQLQLKFLCHPHVEIWHLGLLCPGQSFSAFLSCSVCLYIALTLRHIFVSPDIIRCFTQFIFLVFWNFSNFDIVKIERFEFNEKIISTFEYSKVQNLIWTVFKDLAWIWHHRS